MNLDTRIEILKTSLLIERFLSHFLGGLLNIKDVRKSISLGNKNTALSFNQKINLLIDIGALNSETKAKFQIFMELRNQFMHNIEAKTYTSCLSFMDGKESYLLKKYPQNITYTKETQLRKAVSNLSTEVLELSIGIMDRLKEKWGKDAEASTNKLLADSLKASVVEAGDLLNESIDQQIQAGKNISPKQLEKLGTQMTKFIFVKTVEKMKNK
jgi:hypothetical protein